MWQSMLIINYAGNDVSLKRVEKKKILGSIRWTFL